jgi:hypothetical protein
MQQDCKETSRTNFQGIMFEQISRTNLNAMAYFEEFSQDKHKCSKGVNRVQNTSNYFKNRINQMRVQFNVSTAVSVDCHVT